MAAYGSKVHKNRRKTTFPHRNSKMFALNLFSRCLWSIWWKNLNFGVLGLWDLFNLSHSQIIVHAWYCKLNKFTKPRLLLKFLCTVCGCWKIYKKLLFFRTHCTRKSWDSWKLVLRLWFSLQNVAILLLLAYLEHSSNWSADSVVESEIQLLML